MKAWGVIFWISTGGLTETLVNATMHSQANRDWVLWLVPLVLSGVAWSSTAVCTTVQVLWGRLTGRAMPLPQTDPKALAVELATLNAQIHQLRETATAFDVSFDQTLQRMDERLRRVEQQTPYVHLNAKP